MDASLATPAGFVVRGCSALLLPAAFARTPQRRCWCLNPNYCRSARIFLWQLIPWSPSHPLRCREAHGAALQSVKMRGSTDTATGPGTRDQCPPRVAAPACVLRGVVARCSLAPHHDRETCECYQVASITVKPHAMTRRVALRRGADCAVMLALGHYRANAGHHCPG